MYFIILCSHLCILPSYFMTCVQTLYKPYTYLRRFHKYLHASAIFSGKLTQIFLEDCKLRSPIPLINEFKEFGLLWQPVHVRVFWNCNKDNGGLDMAVLLNTREKGKEGTKGGEIFSSQT